MRRPLAPPSPRPVLLALSVLACAATSALAQGTPPAQAPAASTAVPPAQVQLAPLPDTAQFSQNVDLSTRPAGESLDALIQALARSVGLSAITQGIPPETMGRYNLGTPKPFREVWDIVLTLNGLEYVLRGDNIVVVGPPETLAGLRPQQSGEEEAMTQTYPVSNSPTELQALLESQFPPGSGVVVTAFEELGLVSVQGTEAQQAKAEMTLTQFDRTAATPVRRAYTLSHAKAEDLATVLSATVTAPENAQGGASPSTAQQPTQNGAGNAIRQALTDSLGSDTGSAAQPSEGAATAAEGQFSIAADARSNRIIVTAPANVQRDIAALIEELDKPERQVNVQVRIQEVSSDITRNLGVDLTSAIGNFTTTLFRGSGDNNGLNFVFDAQKAISGFNLGAVLDAYESQGLARRVDDSNLTVLNNGEATLQSGGSIYISIAGNGSVENIERTIEYGVQLTLSPQITNDDEVILNVDGRVDTPVSDLTNPNLLQLTTRNLTSRVTLSPGQTVVLGGLFQNQLTDATDKVPVLGDVPVVGNLFTQNNKREINTELLVIVTANVLE